jgi:hypothetical protein
MSDKRAPQPDTSDWELSVKPVFARVTITTPRVDLGNGTVRFAVNVGNVIVQALISRELLEDRFGAAPDPTTWLQAYQSNSEAIDRMTTRLYLRDAMAPVILHNGPNWTRGY